MDWAELLRRIAQAIAPSPKPSIWHRLSPAMIVISSISAAAAALFAAWSAWLANNSLQDARVQREPVLVIEPAEPRLRIEFNDDKGIEIGLDSTLANKLPSLRISNFGPTPALNVMLRVRWQPPTSVDLPAMYRSQRLSSGANRFSVANGTFSYSMPAGGTLEAPISTDESQQIGIVPPSTPKEARWPLGIIYAHQVFSLQDVDSYLNRIRRAKMHAAGKSLEEQARLLIAAADGPLPVRTLELIASYDTVTGRHMTQRTEIASTSVVAIDHSLEANATGRRVEAIYEFSVRATPLPEAELRKR